MNETPAVPGSTKSIIIEDPRLVADLPKQIAAALDPDNKWFTGEEYGHDPSLGECMRHLAEFGGAAVFRNQHPLGGLPA